MKSWSQASLKIGPVEAEFSGIVSFGVFCSQDHLSLSGASDDGLAGFARGGADVEGVDQGYETLLRYNWVAETGGKIA